MSSKYSVSKSARWRNEVSGRPRLSDHALARWDERMPAAAVAPETAWSQAIQLRDGVVQLLDGRTGRADCATLYAERVDGETYRAIFPVIEREGGARVVPTVLRATALTIKPLRSYLATRAAEVFDVE